MSLNKQQAADYLNKTVRALENLVGKGKIQAHRVKGARGVTEWRFEQDELDRYKNQPPQEVFISPEKPNQALATRDVESLTSQLINALETLTGNRKQDGVPIESKLTLSLEEASALSGFSANQLRDAIKAGNLKTISIGTTGKRKRIRRDDLIDYIRRL